MTGNRTPAPDEPEDAFASANYGSSTVGPTKRPAGATPVPTASKAKPTTGDIVRAGVRGVGQTLVTAGLVVLLFVVYELWVTNIAADAHQRTVHKVYVNRVAAGHDPLKGRDKVDLPLVLPAGKQVILPAGQGFANLYIPRLGKDFAKTIVEGTSDADLDKGPGHYPKTQIPGQIGNFAIAGHRTGKGEPFLNLDKLEPGDPVVVETATYWFVYRVLGDVKTGNLSAPNAQGVAGREIVAPSDVGVILPVPGHNGTKPTKALMTITTCTPKFTASQRMIVHAALRRAVRVVPGRRPRELGGTQ